MYALSDFQDMTVHWQTEYGLLVSELHAIERSAPTGKAKIAEIIPIRFVPTNKISKGEKLLLGFDALILGKSFGRDIQIGKIICGDDCITLRICLSTFISETQKIIEKISALLMSPTQPELVLNRHCPECEFRNRCRKIAKEVDDLSLLSGMSPLERARHRSKGIFTVNQLSYTFRRRRTPKRAKNPAKPHHFSLQARAIREKCVYIHGSPVFPKDKTAVYLDIEVVPDRDFYYLIGVLIVTDERQTYHSFWADSKADEVNIFLEFAKLVSNINNFHIFHYGEYDAVALSRITISLPKGMQECFKALLKKFVNVLSIIYPHVYFPTYSNSLKEIVPFLESKSLF